MAQRDDWVGLMNGRMEPTDVPSVSTPYPGRGSWGGPFEVIADDGLSYYVKALDTCPPGEGASLATELVVARGGHLIGAPTCDTTIIRIPEELAGWEVSPGKALKEGFAHACRTLDGQVDERRPALDARDKDDNRRRQVGAYALFDWFVGCDQQWLHQLDRDDTMWSHDHGLYLPPMHSGGWDPAELATWVGTPHELPDRVDGLDMDAIEKTAQALDAVRRGDLVPILRSVPPSWPVDDDALEALGWFLECRAGDVAERLRALA